MLNNIKMIKKLLVMISALLIIQLMVLSPFKAKASELNEDIEILKDKRKNKSTNNIFYSQKAETLGEGNSMLTMNYFLPTLTWGLDEKIDLSIGTLGVAHWGRVKGKVIDNEKFKSSLIFEFAGVTTKEVFEFVAAPGISNDLILSDTFILNFGGRVGIGDLEFQNDSMATMAWAEAEMGPKSLSTKFVVNTTAVFTNNEIDSLLNLGVRMGNEKSKFDMGLIFSQGLIRDIGFPLPVFNYHYKF